MSLPFFYHIQLSSKGDRITLDEDTSKHVVQVLRMEVNDQLQLTDGKGSIHLATIVDDHKKKCVVEINSTTKSPEPSRNITIGISLLKNSSRFEWFLEKATEIGVRTIIPVICERTEKEKFRLDRQQQIVISAMLQSQQAWLPNLWEPMKYSDYVDQQLPLQSLNLIAHCEKTEKIDLRDIIFSNGKLSILIGPEGDFTTSEIEMAVRARFQPVSIGKTRLRSETAGIAALILLNN